MTGDGPDSEPATDDAPDGSWVGDLQNLRDRPTSPLAEASRLHDLTARRNTDRTHKSDDTPTATTDHSSSSSPLIDAICRIASFDQLTLTDSPTDHRYGRVVGVRATVDGRPYDLDLRLFRRPDDDSQAFRQALADQFDRWATVSDLDGVVPIVEGAYQPRPWTCTAPVDTSLAECSFETLATRLGHARSLAETLAAVHDRGIVHAGLDPAHVVFAAGTDTPQLDSVGLTDVYRRYGDPAMVFDPRYAPPEYFDDRYGVVDRTTDVYGLGAVLYRLFTGEAPYDGSPTEIRECVLTEPFPRPSATADVPDAVDDVVARATATDKFDRYQSVAALLDDVRTLCRLLHS